VRRIRGAVKWLNSVRAIPTKTHKKPSFAKYIGEIKLGQNLNSFVEKNKKFI
jgi:hypothetical protein